MARLSSASGRAAADAPWMMASCVAANWAAAACRLAAGVSALQQVGQPFASLYDVAADVPEAPQRGTDLQTRVNIVLRCPA